jgi:hypothetical protein
MSYLRSFLRNKFGLAIVLSCLMLLVSLAAMGNITNSTAQAASTSRLTLSFTCALATDYKSGSVCVHTQPGAALTIKVKYCTGYYATSKSLQGTHYANSKGNYTWIWEPETKCHGSATAYVTDTWKGQRASASRTFVVR